MERSKLKGKEKGWKCSSPSLKLKAPRRRVGTCPEERIQVSAPAVSRAGTNEANLASADCFRAMEESRFLAWSRKRASRIRIEVNNFEK